MTAAETLQPSHVVGMTVCQTLQDSFETVAQEGFMESVLFAFSFQAFACTCAVTTFRVRLVVFVMLSKVTEVHRDCNGWDLMLPNVLCVGRLCRARYSTNLESLRNESMDQDNWPRKGVCVGALLL